MKNQYFGDVRDLFKYDLVLEILLKNKLTSTFTFIPMLTENERGRNGARIDYSKARAGIGRMELKDFLEKCVKEGRRDIKELERFFKIYKLTQNIDFAIYVAATPIGSWTQLYNATHTVPDDDDQLLFNCARMIILDVKIKKNGRFILRW